MSQPDQNSTSNAANSIPTNLKKSRESIVKKEHSEDTNPLINKPAQISDLKIGNHSSEKPPDKIVEINSKNISLSSNKMKRLKNYKQKQILRRTNRATAKIQQTIEENIADAKNWGFNGRFFEYNEKMQEFNDFFTFPWANYSHDDFLSFLVSHNKTIPEYLDFYKSHARHSNFLRSNATNANESNVRTISGHEDSILTVILNDSGTVIITTSADSTICLWDFKTGALIDLFQVFKLINFYIIF